MTLRKALAFVLLLSCSLEGLLASPITPLVQHLNALQHKARALLEEPVSKIWVYSLVGTDYDGHMMLPHFLAHYGSLGVPHSQFHFDLLHDTEEDDTGLKAAMDLLEQLNIPYLVVAKPYTPALQDIQMMDSLYQMDIAPLDWIIVADTDELFTYGTTSLAEATQLMEADGATFALGEMLDHVAKDGSLAGLQEDLPIWSQYPMVCPVTSEVAKGLPAKVAIHRGFLRVGAGHHHIVEPELARAYFGRHCAGPQCEVVMKKYKQRSTIDLYRKTPYYRYRDSYSVTQRSRKARFEGWSDPVEWTAKLWTRWAKVHHFKWHAGIVTNLRQRALRDSGDCILKVNEETCSPKFQFWQEVARQYAAVASGGFNISRLGCKEGIDTQWNWQ